MSLLILMYATLTAPIILRHPCEHIMAVINTIIKDVLKYSFLPTEFESAPEV
jgi:hypothetical protein